MCLHAIWLTFLGNAYITFCFGCVFQGCDLFTVSVQYRIFPYIKRLSSLWHRADNSPLDLPVTVRSYLCKNYTTRYSNSPPWAGMFYACVMWIWIIIIYIYSKCLHLMDFWEWLLYALSTLIFCDVISLFRHQDGQETQGEIILDFSDAKWTAS